MYEPPPLEDTLLSREVTTYSIPDGDMARIDECHAAGHDGRAGAAPLALHAIILLERIGDLRTILQGSFPSFNHFGIPESS